MDAFIASLQVETSIVLGRWLTLDALLDGVLEREGVPPDERFLPLRSLASPDDAGSVGLTATAARDRHEVFCASSMIPGEIFVRTEEGNGFKTFRPRLRTLDLVGGLRPNIDFPQEEFPFSAKSKKFDVKRGATGMMKDTRVTLDPGVVNWLFRGDRDGVQDIMERVMWIGAKTSSGNGWIVPGSLTIEAVEDAPALFGIVDFQDERLLRPVPAEAFPQFSERPSRRSLESCWPPYWNKSMATDCFVPATVHHDGLVTNHNN